MGKAPANHMLEWHAELCTGEDSECLLGIGGPNTAILAPQGSAKVLSLVCLQLGWLNMLLQGKCCAFCTSLTWWTLVVQNQQLSGILTSNKYRRSISNGAFIEDQALRRILEYRRLRWNWCCKQEAFTIACGGLKGAITSKRSQLVLIGDLSSQLPPLTIRTYVERWNKRGLTLSTMFQGARAICLGTRFHFDDVYVICSKKLETDYPESCNRCRQ